MTDEDRPKGEADLARFLQDWTALWREELQAQASEPEGILGVLANGGTIPNLSAVMEFWRAAMVSWADRSGVSATGVPSSAQFRDPITPGSKAATAAPDARDAEVERLARRVDELEARLAKLEAPRRRRS
jgi:hypothetical protein